MAACPLILLLANIFGVTPSTASARTAAIVAWFAALSLIVAAGAEARSAATPSNASPPTIAGTAVQGETLSASAGSWTGTMPLSFALAWERCDAAGGSCAAIPGETGQNHVVDAADIGSTLRVRETATNIDGSESIESAPTAVVTAQVVPVNVAEPRISGSAVEGSTLVTSTGTWSGGSLTYAFQWLRCPAGGGLPDGSDCAPIAGATSSSHTLGTTDIGLRLRAQVVASNAAGSAIATANPTDLVQRSTTTGPPRNLEEPSLDGTLEAGRLLIASAGSWAGEAPSFAYQWVRCGADGGLPDGSDCTVVPGATSPVYALVVDDVGHRIRVRVTASNSLGVQTAASNPSSAVSPASTQSPPAQAPQNSVLPTTVGSPQVGGTVTASVGFWTGTAPLLYSFQWLRCGTDGGDPNGVGCTAIAAATGTQYAPEAADVGQRLRVQVTARNTLAAVTATSSATTPVPAANGTAPPSATLLPTGAVRLHAGEISIPVTSVALPEHLVATKVVFRPNPIPSRTSLLDLRVRVADTRGYVVRNALVEVRSIPQAGSTARELRTARDGWVRFRMTLTADSRQGQGKRMRFSIRVRKQSDGPLPGISSQRIVQIPTAR